jgi:hypothetical protein
MIKDATGRKWYMRFTLYRQGWHWEAWHDCHSYNSGPNFFRTKARAEAAARSAIQNSDVLAGVMEFYRLWGKRGTICSLTPNDYKAIQRAMLIRGR